MKKYFVKLLFSERSKFRWVQMGVIERAEKRQAIDFSSGDLIPGICVYFRVI